MMSLKRAWPICPKPYVGECLTSWLGRVAPRYELSVGDLLATCGLGVPSVTSLKHLDLYVPPRLLSALSDASGISRNQLKRMTLGYWVYPVYAVGASSSIPTFEQYTRGHRLFSWPVDYAANVESLPDVPWYMNSSRDVLECPICAKERPYRRLSWAFNLVTSCTLHNCELAPAGLPANSMQGSRPLDRITEKVLQGEIIEVCGQKLTGWLWLRFLRSLICEFEQRGRFSRPGVARDEDCELIWRKANVAFPSLAMPYDYFELMGWDRRRELLMLANAALELTAEGKLSSVVEGGLGTALSRGELPAPEIAGYPVLSELVSSVMRLAIGHRHVCQSLAPLH